MPVKFSELCSSGDPLSDEWEMPKVAEEIIGQLEGLRSEGPLKSCDAMRSFPSRLEAPRITEEVTGQLEALKAVEELSINKCNNFRQSPLKGGSRSSSPHGNQLETN